jgi:murein DD-endopeptidase MepM/ murein hydrolase activator NlpD
MVRRLGLALGIALLLVPSAGIAPAGGADLSTIQGKIADAKSREAALTAQIADVTTKIRRLEKREVDVSRKLNVLQHDLDLHRERLRTLAELYRVQTDRLVFLRSQYKLAVLRLSKRVIDIYEGGDMTNVDVALGSTSLSDMLDALDYAHTVSHQDSLIARDVKHGRAVVQVARVRTRTSRVSVGSETRVIAVRTAQVREVHNGLLTATHALSVSRSSKRTSLAAVRQSEREFVDEANGLNPVSRSVAARIVASSAPGDSTPSSHGLIWPVNGPVTSPFGWRWGRMHEGLDIGVGYGTPIHAAAGGTTIYAGWESGYGNFVVIDHGGGMATAYGHQSAIAVHVGEPVAQGQVIGYVGCTGHCFGPHLHFEVRINGQAVDPLGYL